MTEGQKEMTVPYIPGDGIGADIMSATRRVLDAALESTTDAAARIRWTEVLAGEKAFGQTGSWLPEETLGAIRASGVAIKGPLTTPVGGGIRSLNVSIRQRLDLYASVRPVRHYRGVPSPVKEPEKLNVVIYRENTEDVYKGIEWRRGSEEALGLIRYLRDSWGIELTEDTGIGLKPVSEAASKRLVRAALNFAVKKGRPVVTLVHKGNIMKYTEGAFMEWGYELAREEFKDVTVFEDDLPGRGIEFIPEGKVLVNDRIADNMLQQVLTRPDEYSVLAAPNLNGDYLADACAAQVGGLGIAPGANIGDGVAVFEPVHGTAPKYAGKNIANPCALILSGALMLEYLGYDEASAAVETAVESALSDGVMTSDLAKLTDAGKSVGTREFGEAVTDRLA
ncbi:MAG: NADP-dependent isocitrate dehydrogenase [Methanobacteriota archaeon]|nr:MAG: NADP-dependent isocitrate dehydrogenase [Euryarchaeota archaeon]